MLKKKRERKERGRKGERERLAIQEKEDNRLNKVLVEMDGMSSRAPRIGYLQKRTEAHLPLRQNSVRQTDVKVQAYLKAKGC